MSSALTRQICAWAVCVPCIIGGTGCSIDFPLLTFLSQCDSAKSPDGRYTVEVRAPFGYCGEGYGYVRILNHRGSLLRSATYPAANDLTYTWDERFDVLEVSSPYQLPRHIFLDRPSGFREPPFYREHRLNVLVTEGDLTGVAELLAEGANINMGDEQGTPPLHLAAANQNINMARFLLSRGAAINGTDRNLETPLHHAHTSSTDGPAMTNLLLDAGAHINARNRFGETPLFKGFRPVEQIAELVEKGADPTMLDGEGRSVLYRVTELSEFRYLRAKGAPFDVNHPSFADLVYDTALLGNVDLLRHLEKEGLDLGPGLALRNGVFPLHWAALNGKAEMVRFLLERKMDVNELDGDGKDALTIVKELLASNTDFGERRYDMLCVARMLREYKAGGGSGERLLRKRRHLIASQR